MVKKIEKDSKTKDIGRIIMKNGDQPPIIVELTTKEEPIDDIKAKEPNYSKDFVKKVEDEKKELNEKQEELNEQRIKLENEVRKHMDATSGHLVREQKKESKNLDKKFNKRLIKWGTVGVVSALIASYIFITYFAKKDVIKAVREDVNKYAKTYIAQGKQFTVKLGEINDGINRTYYNLKQEYSELVDNYIYLDTCINLCFEKIERLGSDISEKIEENKKEVSALLETKTKELKMWSSEQYGKVIEETKEMIKSDYNKLLDLNNTTSQKVDELLEKILAYDAKLSNNEKAHNTEISSIEERLANIEAKQGEIKTNFDKFETSVKELYGKTISEKEFNQLKDKYEKDNKKLQEQINSLKDSLTKGPKGNYNLKK